MHISKRIEGDLLSIGQQFTTFLSNIQLTENQIQDARTKYDGVCEKLHNNYYSTTYNGSTKLLVGSYGKNTAIAPPTDIDVIFVMPASEYERYNSHYGNGQSHLLQVIKNILLTKYPNTDIRGDGQVVVVNFVSYYVEVVPGFLLTGGKYYIPDTHNGGSWKLTAPKYEMENIQTSNKRTEGNTVRLIKMIKAWKSNCNVEIKSLVIELTVVDFLNSYQYCNKGSTYYDWMIRDYFKYLLSKLSSSSYIPGTYESISYGNSWESKAKVALLSAEKACDLESENLHYIEADEWKKIFGTRFPYP